MCVRRKVRNLFFFACCFTVIYRGGHVFIFYHLASTLPKDQSEGYATLLPLTAKYGKGFWPGQAERWRSFFCYRFFQCSSPRCQNTLVCLRTILAKQSIGFQNSIKAPECSEMSQCGERGSEWILIRGQERCHAYSSNTHLFTLQCHTIGVQGREESGATVSISHSAWCQTGLILGTGKQCSHLQCHQLEEGKKSYWWLGRHFKIKTPLKVVSAIWFINKPILALRTSLSFVPPALKERFVKSALLLWVYFW